MKFKRSFLSILLSLALIVSFMPAMAFAAATDGTDDPTVSDEQLAGDETSGEEGSAEDPVNENDEDEAEPDDEDIDELLGKLFKKNEEQTENEDNQGNGSGLFMWKNDDKDE